MQHVRKRSSGFTIIELIVVIVVIGILATITVVGYGAWRKSTLETQVKSDLQNAVSALESARNFEQGGYPASFTFESSDGVTLTGGGENGGAGFCVDGVSQSDTSIVFYIDASIKNTGPQPGTCATRPINWSHVAAGYTSTCGIGSGSLYCWGSNASGELGNGNTTASNRPVAVATNTGLAGKTITAVSTGQAFACAIASGQAYCWGSGAGGKLGNGLTDDSSSPVAVSTSGVLAGKTLVAIEAGNYSVCALSTEALIYCWGGGTLGNGGHLMGNGTTATVSTTTPVQVTHSGVLSGRTVTEITVGGAHACAIASGQAFCWGLNGSLGYVGDGVTTNRSTPVAVSTAGVLSGKTLTKIGAGNGSSCVISTEGLAYCWGWNAYGGLGDGTTNNSMVPVAVTASGALNGKTLAKVDVGYLNACAISADGLGYCWGGGNFGGMGDGSYSHRSSPVAVTMSGALNGKQLTAVTGFYNTFCGVAQSSAYCWGYGDPGLIGHGLSSSSAVPALVVNPS